MAPAVAAALTLVYRRPSLELLRRLWLPYSSYAAIAVYFTFMESAHVGEVHEPLLTTYLPQGMQEQRLGDPTTYHVRSIVTQCGTFFRYLTLVMLPVPRWMSIDLQLPLAESIYAWQSAAAVLAFFVYGTACLWLLIAGGRRALVGFCFAWPWLFFATEMVGMRISEVFVIYRSYLWLPGLILGAGLLLTRLSRRQFLSATLVAGLAFFAVSVGRLETFSNTYALWDEAVHINRPHEQQALAAFRAYMNRGHALAEMSDHIGAITDYDRALKLSGGVGLVYMNRGVSTARLGDLENALLDFDRALALANAYPAPLRAQIYANRANALALVGRLAEADHDINMAIRLNPNEPTYGESRSRLHALQKSH
jgi:tetratricopeptide (TPR) repeat protein